MEKFLKRMLTRRGRRLLIKNLPILILAFVVIYGLSQLSAKLFPQQPELILPAEVHLGSAGTNNTPAVTITPDISQFEVHYIDVGQGDSSLIVCDNKYMLIDAGENDYGQTVVNYLNSLGITHLDIVVGTHPDSDHVGGLDTVIENVECDKIYLSQKGSNSKTFKDVLTAINKTNSSYINPVIGETIKLGSADVTFIGPVKEYEDNNNNSIALVVNYQGKKFLFMGDTEQEGETDILNTGINVDADVLKCAHHGSKTSSTPAFIEKVSPEYAIISCGMGNPYGHPHKETLTLLRSMDIKTFRTDVQQNIVFKAENGQITSNVGPANYWITGNGVEATVYTGEYVLNTNTKKFHLPTCESAVKMSEKNKEISMKTRYELINEGYSACNSCKP